MVLARPLFIIYLFLLVFPSTALQAKTSIKVGVYNNKPTIFLDRHGVASGLFIDILENIAGREGWALEYVPGHFSEVLEKLKKGEIDLLPAVAFSEKREAFIDFNYTTVLVNWAELYTPRNRGISSFKQLEGKKIAVKQDDIHFQVLKSLMDDFNISCRFLEADEYSTVFEMLQADYTEVGVVNRLYGNRNKNDFGVAETPIIFNPIEMRYAAPERKNELVLATIDAYLANFKDDQNSIYYQAINRWLVVDSNRRVPGWLINLLYTAAAVTLFLLLAALLFRYQVKNRTRELDKANRQLKDEIEKKKKMEERLRKIARVMEASNDAMALVDHLHNHLYSNGSYLNLLSTTEKDLSNQSLVNLWGEKIFREELERPIMQCLQGKILQLQIYPKELAAPRSCWNVTLSPYYSDNGDLDGYVIGVRDVTNLVELENNLKTAQKMEAIGTMASGVAHDLNNILTGIVSFPELIRSSLPPDSPLGESLLIIEMAGKRAAAVVGDLLTLSRNAVSIKEPADLNRLIDGLVDSPEWKNIAGQHPEVDLELELEAENALVNCSQVHIRKSFMNLLHNAVEAAAPLGKVKISTANVKATAGENTAKKLQIRFQDTGPGIVDEHIGHIFEPFYTTKKLGRSGSGLGLAVVWSTIEEHRGTIELKNTSPGAVFEIQLDTCNGAVEQEKAAGLDHTAYLGEGKILVVDDEAEPRIITSRIAEMLGYTVTAVKSGEEALVRLREEQFDLVLLDMILKHGMSGYKTYEKILDSNPGQKAVIISGYATSDDVRKTMELGASFIIKKPYSVEELGRVIKNSLEIN